MVIRENVPLSEYTTFKIGGPARYLVRVESLEDLKDAILWARDKNVRWEVIGAGSNILAADGGFDGLIVVLKSFDVEGAFEGGANGLFKLKAPAMLTSLVCEFAKLGWGGMESLAGIPGTVGGAVKMNAGAFGTSIGDFVREVELVLPDGDVRVLKDGDFGFTYRHFVCPGAEGCVIWSVTVRLKKDDPERLLDRVEEVLNKRRVQQPLFEPSAGSFFLNPLGDRAARLIEMVGLKGLRVGDAKVSERHANFIVNVGKATAKDVIVLAKMIRERVWEYFGILLRPEVRFVGDDPEWLSLE